MVEEIEAAESSLSENKEKDNWQDRWKKVLTNCFQKVDDKIVGIDEANREMSGNDGSESSTEETLAPETVGSTALVAILTQSHIIVANCGDSRAALCRGKEALPLSTDHKVRNLFLVSHFVCCGFRSWSDLIQETLFPVCSQIEKVSGKG